MFDSNRSSSLLGPVGLVWLISLFAGYPLATSQNSTPAKSPVSPPAPRTEALSYNKAFSRLWEDPLEATGALIFQPYRGDVAEAWKGEAVEPREDRPAPTGLENKIKRTIFVLTKGLRYADMAEWRRQQRYAVQAALWAKGYSPVQADQLSYQDVSFRIVFGKGPDTKAVKPGQDWYLRIPFEDYRDSVEDSILTSQEASENRIRVCYLNLNLLNNNPLATICRLVKAMGLSKTKISLSSPPSTDWLNAMLWEDGTYPILPDPDVPTIEIFNTLATGDVKVFKDGNQKTVRVYTGEGESKVIIHQLIEPDSATILAIREEFDTRGLDIGGADWLRGGPCSVAIVSEWETSFGRKFAQRMQDVYSSGNVVQQFNYLRGLSGLPPEGRSAGTAPEIQTPGQRAAEARTPGEAISRTIEAPPLPPPFGPSQYDYIARLGEQLRRANLQSQAAGKGEIRAIGLIGTDIDDKLALLKVLRPRFPNALFFTNEINAEFLQPENNVFARNLIVASHYSIDGSMPRGSGGSYGQLPPFRSSTQPAIVDSIWAALDESPTAHPARKVSLYEVGLRQWHLLSGNASARVSAGAQAPASSTIASWATARPIIALLLASLALVQAYRFWAKNTRSKVPLSYWLSNHLANMSAGLTTWLKGRPLVKPSFRKFLRLLLSGIEPSLETRQVRVLRRDGCPPLPEPTKKNTLGVAANWWFYSGLVAAWGVLWWLSGLEWGSLVVAFCGTAALAWMRLRPRSDHQRIGWVLLASAVLVFIAVRGGRWTADSYSGEPWALADGVCVWPAVVLRLVAAALAIRFVRLAWIDVCNLRDDLTRRFFLEREGKIPGGVRWGKASSAVVAGSQAKGLVPRDFPDHRTLDQGSNPSAESSPPRVNEAEEWETYLNVSDPRKARPIVRWARLIGAVLLIAAVTMLAAGFPAANVRGTFAKIGDMFSLSSALLCLAILCVFVGDQLWQCRKFIRAIWGHGTTGYGFETEETILLVAGLTKGIGDLLVYPFAVCFVLLCAHSGYFERWLGLTGLYAALAVALGTLIVFTLKMQRAAHAVRERTLGYLRLNLAEASWMKRLILQRIDFDPVSQQPEKEWWRYTLSRLGRHVTLPERLRILEKFEEFERKAKRAGTGSSSDDLPNPAYNEARAADLNFHKARIERVEQLITLINSIKEGAFGGLQDNPIFRSILIPSVGLGSLDLVQRLLFS